MAPRKSCHQLIRQAWRTEVETGQHYQPQLSFKYKEER